MLALSRQLCRTRVARLPVRVTRSLLLSALLHLPLPAALPSPLWPQPRQRHSPNHGLPPPANCAAALASECRLAARPLQPALAPAAVRPARASVAAACAAERTAAAQRGLPAAPRSH